MRHRRVSVILPALNRKPALLRTLTGFFAQELADLAMEFIVVDNGSSDGTLAAIAELPNRCNIPLQVLTEPTRGVSAARNAGVSVASVDLVLFVNDDTRPGDPHLVRSHVAAHAEFREPVAIGGRIEYEPEQERRPFMRWLN